LCGCGCWLVLFLLFLLFLLFCFVLLVWSMGLPLRGREVSAVSFAGDGVTDQGVVDGGFSGIWARRCMIVASPLKPQLAPSHD
jgi:hypothetical protein